MFPIRHMGLVFACAATGTKRPIQVPLSFSFSLSLSLSLPQSQSQCLSPNLSLRPLVPTYSFIRIHFRCLSFFPTHAAQAQRWQSFGR
jgi:hypothetical protein